MNGDAGVSVMTARHSLATEEGRTVASALTLDKLCWSDAFTCSHRVIAVIKTEGVSD